MNKLAVIVTDGVGYRNFILSSFLLKSKTYFDEMIVLSYLPESAFPNHILKQFHFYELSIYTETRVTRFFRKTKELAHLVRNKEGNFGILDNYKANSKIKFSSSGLLNFIALVSANIFHTENWILLWTRFQYLSLKNNKTTKEYKIILDKIKPDLLFFTHQRPPFIAPLIQAASENKIKTATFIFSWDNLASKGRMAGSFGSYIVWSDLMKKELLHFYPSVQSKNIIVGGTPQFEPYVMDEFKMSREDFLLKFNISKSSKIICFSCGDISTSKNDEHYIETIAEVIRNDYFFKNVVLLVRTSPAEDPERFSALKSKYDFIVWNFPLWEQVRKNHPEPWTQRLPMQEDIVNLRAILEYSDLSVNMCSTMSLDFMNFDKPVVNPVFGNEKNGLYNDQRFLNYAHYDTVVKSNAVTIVKNKDELITAMIKSLNVPSEKSFFRKQLLSIQIGVSLEDTSDVITSSLFNLVNG